MTQIGVNTGPRHARQLGYAKSYQKKLTEDQCTAHDEDVNGAAGIFWSLILSTMPTEVTTPIVKDLQENKIPHLATRFLEPGMYVFYTCTFWSDSCMQEKDSN